MSNYIQEADYDKFAGSATQYDTNFTYFDYISPSEVVANKDAINNSIRNILLTSIGTLPGRPDFGSNINNNIFNLMNGGSTKEILKNNVLSALLKWEPRITINNITLKEIPEYNKMVINIFYTYNIMGSNIDAETSIVLKDN